LLKLLVIGFGVTPPPPPPHTHRPFIWRDPPSGTFLVAIWHAGGYGGSCPDESAPPGSPELQVACARQCVEVEGLDDVLCLSWRADNQGMTCNGVTVS
jgi:hypothetical protein